MRVFNLTRSPPSSRIAYSTTGRSLPCWSIAVIKVEDSYTEEAFSLLSASVVPGFTTQGRTLLSAVHFASLIEDHDMAIESSRGQATMD